MKGILQIVIFIFLTSKVVFGQEQAGDYFSLKKANIGFNISPIFSEIYYKKNQDTRDNITFDKKFNVGISAGIFSLIPISPNHFSIQLEMNYNYINYHINYCSSITSPGGDYSLDSANFTIHSSYLQISFVPTIRFNKKHNFHLSFGPFLRRPIINKANGQIINNSTTYTMFPDTIPPYYVHGIIHKTRAVTNDNDIDTYSNYSIGLLAGLGMTFPLKENAMGIEFRTYFHKFELVERFKVKQILLTLSLTYQLK